MADESSCPILRLPLIPLREVISYMGPLEILFLSILSKKTRNFVKRKREINLELIDEKLISIHKFLCKNQDDGSTFLSIFIEKMANIQIFKNCVDQKIDDRIVPMKFENNYHGFSLTTCWKDEVEGYQKMTSFLCDVFMVPSFSMKSDVAHQHVSKWVGYFRELKSEAVKNITNIEIDINSLNEVILRDILAKFKDVPKLYIPSLYMTYKHNNVQSSTGNRYCYIENASWFKFEDINMLMKLNRISLKNLKWTLQVVIQFVQNWMDIITMEILYISVDKVDFKMVLEGLSGTPQLENLNLLRWEQGVHDWLKIQRKDGAKAELRNNKGNFVIETYH